MAQPKCTSYFCTLPKALYSILSSQSQTTKLGKFEQAKALVSNIANRTLNLGKTSLRAIQTNPKASMLVVLAATVTAVAYAYGMHNSVMNYFSPARPLTDLRNWMFPGFANRSLGARLSAFIFLAAITGFCPLGFYYSGKPTKIVQYRTLKSNYLDLEKIYSITNSSDRVVAFAKVEKR